jgi:protein-S-isoprenylcysteine O-methyltransferase Ste14
MKKLFVLLYGITNYSLGSAALVYLIAFIFNLFVPFTIDSGEAGNAYLASAINLGLIMLFGLQHSIMARPAFKMRLARYLPKAAERSTFMLATAVVTFALCLLWQPLPQVLWQAENITLHNTLLAIGLGGWALVFYATFLINHFDLFGLRQVWLYFVGKEYTQLPFRLNSLYRYVRHPIMTGVFIGIWFTPVMTAGHLLLALGLSTYIIIGVYHEEKDLVHVFGDRYLRYIRFTGKFLPSLFKGNSIDTKLGTEV